MSSNGHMYFPAVKVDYEIPIEKLVSGYDWHGPEFTSKNFSEEKEKGETEVGIILLPIPFRGKCESRSEEALFWLRTMGYRTTDVRELLAFGVKFPEAQQKCRIVSLDVWKDSMLIRHVPVLGSEFPGKRRYARMFPFLERWDESCRFAAVPVR